MQLMKETKPIRERCHVCSLLLSWANSSNFMHADMYNIILHLFLPTTNCALLLQATREHISVKKIERTM
jgi:hypothetical protein